MSVSKWAYDPRYCDGEGCPGDCDLCNKPRDMEDDMSDYIKREDAVRTMTGKPIIVNQGNVEAVTRIYEEFVKRIDDIPAADVVEVVRCKDCKHKPIKDDRDSWPIFPNEENNPCPCQCDDGFYSWFPKDDFYCSYGERAEE